MPRLLRSCFWVVVVAAALTFIAWSARQRARHVTHISQIGIDQAAPHTATHPSLIVPERNVASYGWLAETRQMLALRQWRVRHIEYENAPYGRDLAAASPYRWWLGLVAAADHIINGSPLDHALDRASLVADPLLCAVAVLALAVFVAWRFGFGPSLVAVIGLGALYPLSASFLPGTPSDRGLVAMTTLASVLLLAVGVIARDAARRRRWFTAAGIVAGVLLWLSPAQALPILAGIFGAAVAIAALRRSANPPADRRTEGLPWRTWAISGAGTTLVAYLVEYFPAHLGGWELRAVHPLYGLAWLCGGELIAQVTEVVETRPSRRNRRDIATLIGATIGLTGVATAVWKTHQSPFLGDELSAYRLADTAGAPIARSVAALIQQDSSGGLVAVLLAPLILVGLAAAAMFVRRIPAVERAALAVTAIPTVVAAGFASTHIAWWSDVEALLVVVLVLLTFAVRASRSQVIAIVVLAVAVCGPGLGFAWPRVAQTNDQPTEHEVFALIDRDLSGWLTQHATNGTPVVIAPPNDTVALSYYGAVRGVATLSWQNKGGLEAAVRILSASTPEEAKALIERRGITHIVMPSWDPYLDQYARMGMGQLDGTFLQRLHEWRTPGWLRPVAYTLPQISGFERQSITIFEVVEEQPDAIALARTAEYFLEMQRLAEASAVAQHLRRFPADMNAWIARAEVEVATGDEESLKKSLNVLLPYLQAKRDRSLPWDLRVGLGIVLARTKHVDQAKQQIQRCVAEATESRVRALSTGALYRLLVLSRAYEAPLKDSKVAEIARSLLPPEARARL